MNLRSTFGLKTRAMGVLLGLPLGLAVVNLGFLNFPAQLAAQAPQQPAHPDVPDAPTPQAPAPMSDLKDQVTPGSGSSNQPAQSTTPAGNPAAGSSSGDQQTSPNQPASIPPAAAAPDTFQTAPPDVGDPGKGSSAEMPILRSFTNAVEVPVTVKDSKGKLVNGLTWRDFRVFENNNRQQIRYFTVDPFPLSAAFVIDQSVTSDVMRQVNTSLGAIQGSLAPYDEVAVYTYNNGAKQLSGFTGAQSHLLTAVLEQSKATGRDDLVPVNSGSLAGCSITSNGFCVDPNIQVGRSAGSDAGMTIPKEIHTLNDAILRAAKDLAGRPQGRRRIIYVISDGKEYGSTAKQKQVIEYLQHYNIAVYATLVGDSARWGEGYLSRFHIPLQMNDNVLIKYAHATGGDVDAEKSANGIEKSYGRIAEEARDRYTIVYYSHQPAIDGKYRSVEVRVDRPNVEVTAKPGYFPTAQDIR